MKIKTSGWSQEKALPYYDYVHVANYGWFFNKAKIWLVLVIILD